MGLTRKEGESEMLIDVSLVPLEAVVRKAQEFPEACFSFSACAVSEQVILEVV